MTKKKSLSCPRPTAVTVLCVILFMIGVSQTVHAFAAFAFHPTGSTLYGILFSAVTLVAYYGLWNMRRWGVILLAAAWSVNIMVLAVMDSDGSFLAQFRFWACVILLAASLAVVFPHWNSFKTPQPEGEIDEDQE
jgi:4-amino-4-deoxy-L-arabinose transferase-like glycosyltransferase